MGDVPFYLKFWAKLTPSPLQNGYFQPIFTRSASALTPSEKVQLSLMGGPLRAFHWA